MDELEIIRLQSIVTRNEDGVTPTEQFDISNADNSDTHVQAQKRKRKKVHMDEYFYFEDL